LGAVLGISNTPSADVSVDVVALQYANGDDLAKAIPELIPGVKASYGNVITSGDEKKDPVWSVTPPGADPLMRTKIASKSSRVLILVGEPQAVAQAKDIALKAEEAARTCDGQIVTQVYYPKYTDVTELGQVASCIAPGVSVTLGPTTNFQLKQGDTVKGTTTSVGGDVGGAYEFKAQPATLILTGPIEDVKRIVSALEKVDIMPAQILIEARIVDIADDDEKALGIDWQWKAFTSSGTVSVANITLNLHPEVSTITGYLNVGSGIALPQIARRFTDSTIRIKNGATVAIGGLIKDQDIENMSKVPLLGDLPILGQLFRHKDWTKKHSEVVIFITATILKDE
jgi:type II secretory pathway component GspD/PulD (secretin)